MDNSRESNPPEPGIATLHQDRLLTLGARRWRVAIGEAGTASFKLEGDRATPRGVLRLRKILFRADRIALPRCVVPIEPIAPNDGWCDDPRHPDYNRQISLPHEARHEALWRADALYDIVGVLGWNDDPVVPGRGSAIFLHVARDIAGSDPSPTAGCLALTLADLREALACGLTGVDISG